jgi:hypothetical protein
VFFYGCITQTTRHRADTARLAEAGENRVWGREVAKRFIKHLQHSSSSRRAVFFYGCITQTTRHRADTARLAEAGENRVWGREAAKRFIGHLQHSSSSRRAVFFMGASQRQQGTGRTPPGSLRQGKIAFGTVRWRCDSSGIYDTARHCGGLCFFVRASQRQQGTGRTPPGSQRRGRGTQHGSRRKCQNQICCCLCEPARVEPVPCVWIIVLVTRFSAGGCSDTHYLSTLRL